MLPETTYDQVLSRLTTLPTWVGEPIDELTYYHSIKHRGEDRPTVKTSAQLDLRYPP